MTYIAFFVVLTLIAELADHVPLPRIPRRWLRVRWVRAILRF